jgi:hypothetical protein
MEFLPDGSSVPLPIDGGKGVLGLRADGVLHLRWKPGVKIATADAQAAMQLVNILCADGPRPMLVDMEETNAVSRGARGVFSLPCGASRIALLGSSPVDRLLANFALGLSSPPCPTHFFTSRSGAIEWLRRVEAGDPAER